MHPSIEKLLNVQRVDREIRFLEEARRLRPQELADEKRKVAAHSAALEAIQEAIKKTRLEANKGELEVKQKDAEIHKARVTLNTVKTNQEYAVIKEQIARHEEERGKIEDSVLQYLEEIDQLEERRKAAQKALSDQEKILARKESELAGVLAGIDAKVAAHRAQRAQLAQAVDRDHLELYERILGHLQDFAISAVKDLVCQGCFTAVTRQDITVLMLGQELMQCRSCGRLLFLE
jgi:hypothetical protein